MVPHIKETSSGSPSTVGFDLMQHGWPEPHFREEAGALTADALHYMHERQLI